VKILLVDDEPALRELLRITFQDAHVQVEEAASAEEAEAAIARRLPDVVVLDLYLPGASGIDLCRRLRADARTAALPIVLLSGAVEEELAEARAAGANAVVSKPFSPLELVARVERLAGRPVAMPPPLRTEGKGEELLLYARDLRHVLDVERRQRIELAEAYRATVTALANALETKDFGTSQHSHRVQRYATCLLSTIDPELLEREPGIEYGFLLHDVGKIGIPDTILRKPARLTDAEHVRMRMHTVLGEQMLSGIPFLQGQALRIVRSHHERWDGGGYPDGLRAEETPLPARVFAVADALDAMTSDRPYRDALPWAEASAEIRREAKGQFDPTVVDAFRGCERELREARRELLAA
jgi:response regulator RpfG family c-di-GMP phosphodiesterase